MPRLMHDENQQEIVVLTMSEYNELKELVRETEKLCGAIDDRPVATEFDAQALLVSLTIPRWLRGKR